MKRIEDIKEFEDIDTYYNISNLVEEIFQDRVEAHKHLVSADKEIERLNKELQDTKEHLGEYLYEQEEENKRLNNIINESAEEILKELEENHHLSYGVALAIRQKLIDYKELKGSDK